MTWKVIKCWALSWLHLLLSGHTGAVVFGFTQPHWSCSTWPIFARSFLLWGLQLIVCTWYSGSTVEAICLVMKMLQTSEALHTWTTSSSTFGRTGKSQFYSLGSCGQINQTDLPTGNIYLWYHRHLITVHTQAVDSAHLNQTLVCTSSNF